MSRLQSLSCLKTFTTAMLGLTVPLVGFAAGRELFDFRQYATALGGNDSLYDNLQGTGTLLVTDQKGQRVQHEITFRIAGSLCRVDVRRVDVGGEQGPQTTYCVGPEAAFTVKETEKGRYVLRDFRSSSTVPPQIQFFFSQYLFAPYGPVPNPGHRFLSAAAEIATEKPFYELPSFRSTGYPTKGEGLLQTHETAFAVTDKSGQPVKGRLKVSTARGWLLDHLEYSYNRTERPNYTIDVEYPTQDPRPALPSRVKFNMFGSIHDFTFNSIDKYKAIPADFDLKSFGLGAMKSPPKQGWLQGGGWLFLAAGLLVLAALVVRRSLGPRGSFLGART